MEEKQQGEKRGEEGESHTATNNNDTLGNVSSRIHKALQLRLAMVLPYVASNRWHEGMAIGALPQNAYHTAQQLDEMATIVLDYALENAQLCYQKQCNKSSGSYCRLRCV